MVRHGKTATGGQPEATNDHRRRRAPVSFDIAFPIGYAVLYAVVLIAVQTLFFPIGDTGVETDFYGDLAVAARELAGGDFTIANYPYKGPVYSFILILFYTLVGEWYRSGAMLNTVFAAASLVVLYRFIRRIFNRPVALFTVISVSLVPEFFLLAHKASSDMLFFFLCLIVLERIVSERVPPVRLCIAGVLSALAFLTRYIGVFLPAAAVITLLPVNPAGISRGRRASLTALYLCIFIIACLPWFVAGYRETGAALSTRNLENVIEEFYGDRNVPEGGFSSLRDVVSNDPLHFITHYLKSIPVNFWKDMSGTLGLVAGVLVMLGLARLLVIPPSGLQASFYIFSLLYFLSLCTVFHLKRFSIPLLPAYYALGFSVLFGPPAGGRARAKIWFQHVFPWQVRFVRGIWNARVGGGGASRLAFSGRHGIITVLIAVILTFQAIRIVRYERMYYARRPLFVFPAARFLKRTPFRTRLREAPVLMARKPHVAFYSNIRFQYYPDGFYNVQHFLSFAIERDVDFVVVSALEMEYYPDAEYLWRLDATPGVEKIYDAEEMYIYALAEWLSLRTDAGRELLGKYVEDLAVAESAGDHARVLDECLNISGMYSMNGDWDEKVAYLARALRAVEQLPDPSSRWNYTILLKLNISEAYLLLGTHEEGISLIEEYLPQIERHGTDGQLAIAHILISRHYEELGRLVHARRRLSIALEIYRAQGDMKHAGMVRRAMERLEGTEKRP